MMLWIESLMQIKLEATAKREVESREKSILTAFLAFFGLRILMKRTDSMLFLIEHSSTSVKLSIENLMQEIKTGVTGR